MLRFYNGRLNDDCINAVILDKGLLLDADIWGHAHDCFCNNVNFDVATLQLLEFYSEDKRLRGYIYQDIEANRELRMLDEIENCKAAYQFRDIYPEITKVIIIGVNELAYKFVKYLQSQDIEIGLVGPYWNYLGFKDLGVLETDENTMVIYAEGENQSSHSVYECKTLSVSSEFECIDKIYEKNVLDGFIHDSEGDFDWLIGQIKKRPVFVIGTNDVAQDTYDLLFEHGVDISGFINMGGV